MVPSLTRVVRASLAAAACCLILATHAFVDFPHLRVRAVREPVPATAGLVEATVSAASVAGLRPPFAVIGRIRHDGAGAEPFEIRIDQSVVCQPVVRGGPARRVDCAMSGVWNPAVDHRVAVRSAAPGWTLEYLELSTHHGSSTGAVSFIVLPEASDRYTRPAPGWIVLVGLGIVTLLLRPDPAPPGRLLRVLYRTFVGLSVLWFGLVLLSPLVSPFSVVLRTGPLLGWIALLFLPRWWAEGERLFRLAARTHASWAWAAATALVALVVLVPYGALFRGHLEEYGGNHSGFLKIATRWFDGHPTLSERQDIRRSLMLEADTVGYDAQFMYLAAYDPFLTWFRDDVRVYDRFIDTLPYRYGRIGFSLLTKVVSGDQWQRYPAAMMWLILAGLALTGALLALTAQAQGSSAAWGTAAILVPGFWASLQVGLPEPVSAAALVGGYLCAVRQRWAAAGLLFALSLLVRETGAVLVLSLAAWTFFSGRRREAMIMFTLALLPVIAWRMYLGWVLFSTWGTDAFMYSPANFGVPFGGIVDVWIAMSRGTYWPDLWPMARAGLALTLLAIGGFVLAMGLAVTRPGPVTLAAAGYAVLAVTYNMAEVWEDATGVERLTSELFVVLALASTTFGRYPRALRRAIAVFWVATGAYIFLGSGGAEFVLESLLTLGHPSA